MKILRNILIGFTVLVLGGYAFCKATYPTTTFRYKLTAEVMTPQGLKTGSSVIEASYSSVNPLPNPGRWAADDLTGEAVYVDLGQGKNLFVLLTDRLSGRFDRDSNDRGGGTVYNGALKPLSLPIRVFDLERMPGEERVMARQAREYLNQPARLVDPINLPTLVTFRDIGDPNSVEVVQPESLSKSLGEGYELVKATLQITDEMPVERIEGILPWLKTKKIEWRKIHSIGLDDPIITRLFYDAFKEPGLSEGPR
jgi:hypothetical protein